MKATRHIFKSLLLIIYFVKKTYGDVGIYTSYVASYTYAGDDDVDDSPNDDDNKDNVVDDDDVINTLRSCPYLKGSPGWL